MYSLLLALIYVAFISLGLPDSLLGAAWPVMRVEFSAPLSFAGAVSMVISGGTIISSLLSDRLTRKLGPGLVTAISVGMTAAALFGFSFSKSAWMLFLFAVPYGLGAGAVDAALNNYAAIHCTSRQMSWLHCFWGVGASISPYIMSFSLATRFGWQGGYRAVGMIQVILTAVLFLALPLWRKNAEPGSASPDTVPAQPLGISGALKISGVPFILFSFFGYCALESTTGLWASSYLAEHRGVGTETAAMFSSLFYLGITFGRFVSGFVADRLGDRRLIRIGVSTVCAGLILVMLPLKTDVPALAGLLIVGLGGAPVYPAIIHSTPENFGRENSQAIVGIQMACAYCGSTFVPPLFGLIANNGNLWLYPFFLAVFAALTLLTTELLNRRKKQERL